MSVLQQMKDMLSPLGIYSLSDDSLVLKEITVYANALEKLHSSVSLLVRELFVNTAQDYGIKKAEEIFEKIRPDLSLEERRARLIEFFSLDGNNFSESDIAVQLMLSGINLGFETEDEAFRLLGLPETNDPVVLSEYYKTIEDIIPAHLYPDVGIHEITWDEFDALNYSAGQWEKASLRFDFFEQ